MISSFRDRPRIIRACVQVAHSVSSLWHAVPPVDLQFHRVLRWPRRARTLPARVQTEKCRFGPVDAEEGSSCHLSASPGVAEKDRRNARRPGAWRCRIGPIQTAREKRYAEIPPAPDPRHPRLPGHIGDRIGRDVRWTVHTRQICTRPFVPDADGVTLEEFFREAVSSACRAAPAPRDASRGPQRGQTRVRTPHRVRHARDSS